MSALYTRRRKKPEINLVPLIDVLVMLVFTSFVTMQFKSISAMNLTLPKAESAGKNDLKDSITITIDKTGTLFINERTVKPDELGGALKQIASVRKDITVLIRADETSQLKYAIEVMDACNKYGLTKVRMQMKQQ
jgi:biopolymer transport protein ExbD